MIAVLEGHRRRRRLTYFLLFLRPFVRSAVSVVVALRAPILPRSDRRCRRRRWRRVGLLEATSGSATMWPAAGVVKDVPVWKERNLWDGWRCQVEFKRFESADIICLQSSKARNLNKTIAQLHADWERAREAAGEV